MKYCEGWHFCQICKGKPYKCNGEEISHSGSSGSGRCHGVITQFCPDHTIKEYIAQHKLNGEL